MLKFLLAAAFAAFTLFPVSTTAKTLPKDATVYLELEGVVDFDMLKNVRGALALIKGSKGEYKNLSIGITSPGGYLLVGVEIVKILREASDAGIIVEFRASILCASACTVILASGTPGYRHIAKQTLFIVHSLQSSGMGSSCEDVRKNPTSQDDRAVNVQWFFLRDWYVKLTGKSPEEVTKWLTCGNEQVGDGSLALTLGIADILDK